MYSKKNIKIKNDNYVKPNITAIDLLTPGDIKKRLINYEKITTECVEILVPSTRIQYFEIMKDNKFRYKPGGAIIKNGYPDYLVLSNGRISWSVQLKNHIIFKEINVDTIVNEYKEKLKKKDLNIRNLRFKISTQKDKIQEYENIIKKYKLKKHKGNTNIDKHIT